jgi:hypothetical protein
MATAVTREKVDSRVNVRPVNLSNYFALKMFDTAPS